MRGIPGKHNVPQWILGSSMSSANLAARLGLPYSFAPHFAPHFLRDAVTHYRANLKPSAVLDTPYVIAGVNVFAADTQQEAQYHASSHFHWVNLLYQGRPRPLPEEDYLQRISATERHNRQQGTAYTAMGNVTQVGDWLRRFITLSEADELIIDARIHDPVALCRSYQLAAEDLMTRKSSPLEK